MGQSHSQRDDAAPEARTDFAGRPPSESWETFPLADFPQHYVWAWFKPANVSQGLVLRIPDETFAGYPHRDQLTMRKLLQAAGVEPSCVSMWSLYGAPYAWQNGASPSFDQAIPAPVTGADPNIVVCVGTAHAAAVQHAAAPASADEGRLSQVFDRIDADWKASLEMEKKLAKLRKQLLAMLNRVNSLNRDLTPEESSHSDKLQKKAWQDARRWLRDVATRLSRYMKEYDIGDTSSGGKKNRFKQTYKQYIVPRRPFEGVQQVQREFEVYRKQVQTLLSNMNAALSSAAQDGERRAQQVLTGIAASVRAARSRR